jgi:ribosome-binding protein aMBF1 (putative translation factor)
MTDHRKAIRNALERSGLTASDLARKLGRNKSTVSRYLSGRYDMPGELIDRAFDLLGLEIRERRTGKS